MALPCTKMKLFMQQKKQCLSKVDLSRKGSVDTPIVDLVNFINGQPDCFTTSSCSGRIIVVDNTNERGDVQKQGCKWLYVSHEEASSSDICASLHDLQGAAVFKFEPMVMHIQAQSLHRAQQLHSAAVTSGFRNSGITMGGKGKIIVAVRSTHSLEVPVSCDGELLVTETYLKYLADCANKKMKENITRICRFYDNLKLMVSQQGEEDVKGEKQVKIHPAKASCVTSEGQFLSRQTGATEAGDRHSVLTTGQRGESHRDIEESFDSLLFEET